jgi:tetratricopeptide (TPR) repeat protein
VPLTKHPGKPQDGSKTPRVATARRRLWLFRIVAATAVPALAFLAAEVGLRLFGYGYPSTATIDRQVNDKAVVCDNGKFAWRYFPPKIAREFDPFLFPASKAEGTCRIFVLGASAAQGVPDPAYGFGRILEVLLREVYPTIPFEVIVAAMPAINSHVVYEIAKDCARYEPDLFVVYLGNNEVVGPYGPGTVFAPLSDSLRAIRFQNAVRASRLGQLVGSFLKPRGAAPEVWGGMKMFLDKQVRADDGRLETTYAHFLLNLGDIGKVAKQSGADVLLCTVGVNLKDSPPFASLHRPDLSAAERTSWEAAYQSGAEQEAGGAYAAATEYYLQAAGVDATYADLQFRLGRCLWAVGKFDEARQRFLDALRFDTLRLRADLRINSVVEYIADDRAGVHLVDAAAALAAASPHETPGEELFLEHVHLNFQGNYLVARAVFEQARTILPALSDASSARPLPSAADCARRLAYSTWDQFLLRQKLLEDFIKIPPFTHQLYHDARVARMERELTAMGSAGFEGAMGAALELYRHALEQAEADWWLHWKYGNLLTKLKRHDEATAEYLRVQNLVPFAPNGYESLGRLHGRQGNLDAAIREHTRAVELRPNPYRSHFFIGQAYQTRGDTTKATEQYSRALELQPDCIDAYNNLAEIHGQQGAVDEAIATCRKALAYAPDNAVLHVNLGLYLNQKGHRSQAIEELRTATQLEPDSAEIRGILETLLQQRN